MIHIITPFVRPENFFALRDMIPIGFDWIILPLPCGEPEPGCSNGCYVKINRWIDTWERAIRDDDWFAFLCDDDGYPEGFWNKFVAWVDEASDVAIVSMERGERQVGSSYHAHPTWPLIASACNMSRTRVGLEQMILRGSVLKTFRIKDDPVGDGMLAESLVASEALRISYMPNLFVRFNWLEPGRYNK